MLKRHNLSSSFLRSPGLTGNAGRTFRLHVSYAVLDAAAGGILLNAPIVALKAFQAADWHLPLRELYSGLGMIATLYLAGWMATRPKMPFVFIPGVMAAISSASMAFFTGSPFWFLTLYGCGAMFEIATRPAVTAILRANYPVEQRGHATGVVRKWSSLTFVALSLASAVLLHLGGDYHARLVETASSGRIHAILAWLTDPDHTTKAVWVLASLLSLAAFICFRRIRVDEDPKQLRRDLKPEFGKSLWEAITVAARDRRYRRYLVGCLPAGFFMMLYFPLLWSFFNDELEFGYVGCSALMHAIPAGVAFLMTGAVGWMCDRTNPWVAWGWIRVVWGLDALLLAATPGCALVFAPALFVLPLLGRVLRGSVQGGWWIMWWQLGITHFAAPGADTSRYMGIMVFLDGSLRLLASATGMALAYHGVAPRNLIVIGGLGVILSGVYSLWMAVVERREQRPETMADFERQFDGDRE